MRNSINVYKKDTIVCFLSVFIFVVEIHKNLISEFWFWTKVDNDDVQYPAPGTLTNNLLFFILFIFYDKKTSLNKIKSVSIIFRRFSTLKIKNILMWIFLYFASFFFTWKNRFLGVSKIHTPTHVICERKHSTQT